MKHKVFSLTNFKAVDGGQGVFEAIVAVFNNVDRIGDKIIPGAFKATLERWAAKKRPIPVIFAHEWDNLDAHIGEVLEAKEVEEGLYVKAQLDLEEPFAKRVWKKMVQGLLAEFSFAYDIVEGGWIKSEAGDFYELRELELHEVGPCLVGMNPETRLLGVKTAELELLQKMHDMLAEIGAKLADESADGDGDADGEDEGQDEAGDGKSRSPRASTVAARLAAELLEM